MPDALVHVIVNRDKPWGVVMKKYNGDGPGYGLFDFATATRDLDAALNKPAVQPAAVAAAVWQNDFATSPTGMRPYRKGLKRAFDTLVVLLSAPFTLPVVLIASIALWLEGGSPFYRQQRIGRGGKEFSILKLRTMVRNADKVLEDTLASDPALRAEWDSLQKLIKDPRVTRVGAFLRATSLDELPQLWNVLRGDMSLVGPRPMMPQQEAMYGDMRAYNALRPGITGKWQISARNGNTFSYRNEVDGAYEQTLSFGNDMAILVKTVGVVVRQTGC